MASSGVAGPGITIPLERRERQRILVVEDDPEMLSLLIDVLRNEGYLALGESDSLSGLMRLFSDGADVLLTDWKMPDFDGFKLLGTVRRCFPDLPVILVTAYGTAEVRRRAIARGAFGFLTKPLGRAELLAEVESALLRHRRPSDT